MNENENQNKEKSNRESFLKNYAKNNQHAKKDIFEDYELVNSFETDLTNTRNKLVLSLHKRKNNNEDYLLKWQIGRSSLFIDAKITFVVSEAMRHLTEDIVPDELKPLADIKQVEDRA